MKQSRLDSGRIALVGTAMSLCVHECTANAEYMLYADCAAYTGGYEVKFKTLLAKSWRR